MSQISRKLTGELSEALARLRQSWTSHDPGQVPVDMAVAVADGPRTICEVAVMGDHAELFGQVALDSSCWRLLDRIDEDALADVDRAQMAAREVIRTPRAEAHDAALPLRWRPAGSCEAWWSTKRPDRGLAHSEKEHGRTPASTGAFELPPDHSVLGQFRQWRAATGQRRGEHRRRLEKSDRAKYCSPRVGRREGRSVDNLAGDVGAGWAVRLAVRQRSAPSVRRYSLRLSITEGERRMSGRIRYISHSPLPGESDVTDYSINYDYKVTPVSQSALDEGAYEQTMRADFLEHYQSSRDIWTQDANVRVAVAELLGQLDGMPGTAHVLDVGTGHGRDAGALLSAGHTVTGIDLVSSVEWDSMTEQWPQTARFVESSLLELPLDTSPFDAVLDVGCLHHQHPNSYSAYVQKIRDLLCPGGLLVVLAFGVDHSSGRLFRNSSGRLYREFSPSELRDLIEEHGFECIRLSQPPRHASGVFLLGTFSRQ